MVRPPAIRKRSIAAGIGRHETRSTRAHLEGSDFEYPKLGYPCYEERGRRPG